LATAKIATPTAKTAYDNCIKPAGTTEAACATEKLAYEEAQIAERKARIDLEQTLCIRKGSAADFSSKGEGSYGSFGHFPTLDFEFDTDASDSAEVVT
jgi:hypothetical protein